MNKAFVLFCLVALLSSCGIKKTATNSATPSRLKTTSEIIKEVNSSNNCPHWLSLKGKAVITQEDQDISVGISIKNRKDSIIWISAIGPFGIEIIRAQITPDHIFFVNRINQTYWRKPISRLKDFINSEFSFFDIQDLITSNQKILKGNYILELNEIGFYLKSDNASYLINECYRPQYTRLIDKKKTIEIKQEEYHKTDGFPRKITLIIQTDKYFKAVIKFSKVEFNKAENIIFKIPDSYDEIK